MPRDKRYSPAPQFSVDSIVLELKEGFYSRRDAEGNIVFGIVMGQAKWPPPAPVILAHSD